MLRSQPGAIWDQRCGGRDTGATSPIFTSDHIEPTGVLRGEADLEAAQDASASAGGEGSMYSAPGLWIGTDCPARHGCTRRFRDNGRRRDHACSGVVHGGRGGQSPDVAPALMTEGDEQIDGAVAAILIIIARSRCPGWAGIGWRTSPISWTGVSSKQTSGRAGSGARRGRRTSSIRAMYSPSTRGMHHIPAPWLEVVLGQAGDARSFARQAVVIGELDHRVSQQCQRPAFAAGGRPAQVATSRASSLPVSLRSAPGRGPRSKPAPDCLLRSGAGPVDAERPTHSRSGQSPRFAAASIGRQQNLRPA